MPTQSAPVQQFAEAFRREMKQVFPEQTLTRIPVNHPLFRPGLGGDDIKTVSRRQPEASRDGRAVQGRGPQVEPFWRDIQFGDRYAVIFSPFDVSCALESHEVAGMRGIRSGRRRTDRPERVALLVAAIDGSTWTVKSENLF